MGKARPETIAMHRAVRVATIAEMRRRHAREWHIEFGKALQRLNPQSGWHTQKSAADNAAAKELHRLFPAEWLRVHDAALTTAKGERGWSAAPRRLSDHPAYEVTCPHCSAGPRERCRQVGGKPCGIHRKRIARAA